MKTIFRFQPTDWPFAMRWRWTVGTTIAAGREDLTKRRGGGLNTRDMAVSEMMFELRKAGKLKAFEVEISLHAGALRWVNEALVKAIMQYEETGEDWPDLFLRMIRDARSKRVAKSIDNPSSVDEFKGLW